MPLRATCEWTREVTTTEARTASRRVVITSGTATPDRPESGKPEDATASTAMMAADVGSRNKPALRERIATPKVRTTM